MNANEHDLDTVKQIVKEARALLERAGWIGNEAVTPGPCSRWLRRTSVASLRALAARMNIEGLDEQLDELEAIERTMQLIQGLVHYVEVARARAFARAAAPALDIYHAAKRLKPAPGSELEAYVRTMHRALRAAERKGETSRRR